MSAPTIVEIMLSDPLSEGTRRKRRILLGVSVLSFFMVKTGLLPKNIPALGVVLAETHQKAFLGITILVVLYFFMAFIIYGLSDFVAWMVSYNEGSKAVLQGLIDRLDQKTRGVEQESKIRAPKSRWLPWLRRFVVPLSCVRAMFEFILPLVVGAYAVYVLMVFHCKI